MKSFKSIMSEGYTISKGTAAKPEESSVAEIGYKPNDYSKKTHAQLHYIMKDASEAAKNMKGMDSKAEAKYLDQVNDASTELYKRKKAGINVNESMSDDDQDEHDWHSYKAGHHENEMQGHARELMNGPSGANGGVYSAINHLSGNDDHEGITPDKYQAMAPHMAALEDAMRKAHEAYHGQMVAHHKEKHDEHLGHIAGIVAKYAKV